MKENQIIEKVGISKKSYTDAVNNAIKEVEKNNDISWFEVIEFRGRVDKGKIEYQTIIKIGI